MNLEKLDTGSVWITLYFVFTLSITLHNKFILNSFQFPWSLTVLHILISGIGSYLFLYLFQICEVKSLNFKNWLKLGLFSLLYTLNIAISNVSLEMISLPLHQIIRSTNPVITIFLEYLFFRKIYSLKIYFSLIPVIIGVCIATYGELSYTWIGLLMTTLGVFLAALKGIITNLLLVGDLKLHPMEIIYRMTFLAGIQCFVYCYFSGEIQNLIVYFKPIVSSDFNSLNIPPIIPSLVINSILAFVVNIVSFTANKKTSALSMTVAGNIRQVLSIVFAIVLMKYVLRISNAIGIVVTLLGGAYYSYLHYNEKKNLEKNKFNDKSQIELLQSEDFIGLTDIESSSSEDKEEEEV